MRCQSDSEALTEARQRLGEKATVRKHAGVHKIGYTTKDRSLIIVGKGMTWDAALMDAFGTAAVQ
jgi:hypothetical protein